MYFYRVIYCKPSLGLTQIYAGNSVHLEGLRPQYF